MVLQVPAVGPVLVEVLVWHEWVEVLVWSEQLVVLVLLELVGELASELLAEVLVGHDLSGNFVWSLA